MDNAIATCKITSKSVVRMQRLIPCCPGSLQPLPRHATKFGLKKHDSTDTDRTQSIAEVLLRAILASQSHISDFLIGEKCATLLSATQGKTGILKFLKPWEFQILPHLFPHCPLPAWEVPGLYSTPRYMGRKLNLYHICLLNWN